MASVPASTARFVSLQEIGIALTILPVEDSEITIEASLQLAGMRKGMIVLLSKGFGICWPRMGVPDVDC